MKNILNLIFLTGLIMYASACSSSSSENKSENGKGTFGYDVQFLKKHTDVVVLHGKDSPGKVLVTPKMQGRVMTSTLAGDSAKSLGWVNHDLIESGEIKEHFTPYGGEDRFWIGPEGGQYSVFIEPGKEMVFENWYVPAGFNTESWNTSATTDTSVAVQKKLQLTNYSKNQFDINVKRTINMLDDAQTEMLLGVQIPDDISRVAYETENTIQNIGEKAWTQETGTISIWILSMFSPDPGITIAIPFKKGSESELGSVVTTDYFAEIGSDRLKIGDGVAFLKIDGKKRGKLGISPRRAKTVAGSYDETNNILTIINYSVPSNTLDYMNQLWKQQKEPYRGNVVYAYNDGPLEDGSQLGPFYEMESSSPAAFLKPQETMTHNHRVFHFSGDKKKLNQIAESVLGISIEEISSAFED